MEKKIYLLGMPGSGKTTLGKGLAKRSQLPFIDLDGEIEKHTGMTINEIFENKGEPEFRKIESKLLNKFASSQSAFVMATGGGAPCFFDNIERLNQSGKTIYLKISVKELFKRLKAKIAHRPLLKEKKEVELKKELKGKLADRKKYYENADIIIENDNISINEIFELLIKETDA